MFLLLQMAIWVSSETKLKHPRDSAFPFWIAGSNDLLATFFLRFLHIAGAMLLLAQRRPDLPSPAGSPSSLRQVPDFYRPDEDADRWALRRSELGPQVWSLRSVARCTAS